MILLFLTFLQERINFIEKTTKKSCDHEKRKQTTIRSHSGQSEHFKFNEQRLTKQTNESDKKQTWMMRKDGRDQHCLPCSVAERSPNMQAARLPASSSRSALSESQSQPQNK